MLDVDPGAAFDAFVDLPPRVAIPLELAIHLNGDGAEHARLEARGWRVREAHDVAATLEDFQQYVQRSRGEFGCAKPAYVRMRTSWISDRTVCYLASGRPAVIQDTGPSRHLDDRDGMRRFRTLDEGIGGPRPRGSARVRHRAHEARRMQHHRGEA